MSYSESQQTLSRRRFLATTGLGIGLGLDLAGCSRKVETNTRTADLRLHARSRRRLPDGTVEAVESELEWAANRTAIIIVDMWDDHWCASAAERVAELAVPMNEVVTAARDSGVFVIHAPSSTVDFYEGTPQRRRAQTAPFAETPVPLSDHERWGTTWCWPDPDREPNLPIDDSDMGCDCEPQCEIYDAWTRQIDTLTIHDDDAITDVGQEAYNLLEERGIDNVILMGVHLNMCVLGRPVGIRQMTYLGKNVLFVRDMTDAMYNSKMSPYVDHFAGTTLVSDYVEEYWCPSITSVDLVGGSPFMFREDPRRAG